MLMAFQSGFVVPSLVSYPPPMVGMTPSPLVTTIHLAEILNQLWRREDSWDKKVSPMCFGLCLLKNN